MEFTREQRKEAVKKLPQEIKDFLYSDEFNSYLGEIGKQNNLLLDKLSIIEDEIFLVVSGLKPAANFVSHIQQRLDIDLDMAQKIGERVNLTIFSRIRHELNAPESPTPAVEGVGTANPTERDNILAEIENPTPSTPPITVNTGGPAAPNEIIPESKESLARDFISEKLTETVSIPPQRASIKPEPTLQNPNPEEPKQRGYEKDPYREPTM
jgi:hypothetical protein